MHIHVRIRTFDASGTATFDFLSQLFFDDTLTDTVYTRAPYSSRPSRDTRDAVDRVYGSDGASVLLHVVSDGAGGYVGSFTFGLSDANQSSGGATTAVTPTASDTSVAATLATATCTRGALGTRTAHARVRSSEAVSLDVRLLRGSKVVARKTASVSKGSHTVNVPIARSVAAGRVTLSVTAKDAGRNTKVLSRILQIPQRSA